MKKMTALTLALLAACAPAMAATTSAPAPAQPSVDFTVKDTDDATFLRGANSALDVVGGYLVGSESRADPRTGAPQTTFRFGFRDPLAAGSFIPALALANPPPEGVPLSVSCKIQFPSRRMCLINVFGGSYRCYSNNGIGWECKTA